MNKELFADCIARLRELPDSKFDMSCWMRPWAMGEPDTAKLADLSCDTCGCVLGWCCVWYPDKFKFHFGYVIETHKFSGSSYDTASAIFDIEYDAAYRLFSSYSNRGCSSPTQMADKMQKFLDTYED